VKDTKTVERVAAMGFATSAASSVALGVTYWVGGQTQFEGVFLAAAFGGLALGLGLWAKKLLSQDLVVEEKESFEEGREVPGALVPQEVGRRRFLLRMLGGAGAFLGIVALFPLRSLGPRPGEAYFRTTWTARARLVDENGIPVHQTALDMGSVLTVFPEGHADDIRAQTLLIRLDPREVRPLPGREDWVAAGHIAYSKICTHAACPVGLYKPDTHRLFCPCHQSTFDVLNGARPELGPAAPPLPQLPLALDEHGYLIAQSDYPEPVGPSFWERERS
jgi:ubiquinol-cytochrome c reductase iron-sulfur subunit